MRAPDSTLTPEWLNEPLLGSAEKNEPTKLARPCPMNSWLPCSVSLFLRATAREMAAQGAAKLARARLSAMGQQLALRLAKLRSSGTL